METILVAGATGMLGRVVTLAARQRGYRVRAMVRRTVSAGDLGADEVALADPVRGVGVDQAMAGVDRVFSALGASVNPAFGRGYRSFAAVDTPANTALIAAAGKAGVKRFVYVSVGCHQDFSTLRYVSAHEAVVTALRASGIPYGVLRPMGFFSAFAGFIDLARRGPVPLMGNAGARTNPIADEDLAALALDVLGTEGREPVERTVGGPVTYTRRSIVELAFAALGKPPRFRPLPDGLVKTLGVLFRPLNPRVADLLQFFHAASSQDCLGEPTGTRRLDEFFARRVEAV